MLAHAKQQQEQFPHPAFLGLAGWDASIPLQSTRFALKVFVQPV
jgi:hypothetical protein